MTNLFTFILTILACLALAQLNIVLFGIVKRALQDKSILGEKELITVYTTNEDGETTFNVNPEMTDTDEEETEEETAEETEDAANEQQEPEKTDANAAEENGESAESEQVADLAAKLATLATEISTLAAKTDAKK